MKILIFILLSVSYSVSLLNTDAHSRSIVIENSVIKNIDAAHFKTSSFNRIGEYEKYFNSPDMNMQMTSFFKQIGIKTFRLHAPVYQHTDDKFESWNSLAYYGSAPLQSIVDDLEFIKWASKNGFKVILQINTSNYYDKNRNKIILANEEPDVVSKIAASHATFFNILKRNNLLSTILYVEFGNEDYIGMTTYPGTKPKVYAKIVNETIAKLKPIYPALKYCIVGQSVDFNHQVPKDKGDWTVSDWTKTVLLEIKRYEIQNDIAYVAHHAYADEPFVGVKLAVGKRLSPNDIPDYQKDWDNYKLYKTSETGSVAALKKFLSQNGLNKTLIEVNEFRRGGYNTYYNRSYMNLLANLDPWVAFLNDDKISGSLLWESFNSSDIFTKSKPWEGPMGYGVIIRKPTGFELSMPGYIYKIMDLMFTDQATILKTNDLFSCALIEGNKLKLLYYNKSSEAENLSITLQGFTRKAGNLSQNVIYTDSLSDFRTNPSTGKTKQLKEDIIQYSDKIKLYKIKPYSINIFTYDLTN